MMNNAIQPAVSVIIPIYMVEEYLRECLDSAVNQTLKNIEIICVDDGSPDHSVDIVNEYAAKYDNIVLVRKENGGLSSARNAGLDVATGRYVYFLDSDDYIETDMFETLCRKADEEDLDIVYFNAMPFFDSAQIKRSNQNYVDYYTRRHDYPGVHTGQSMFAAMRKNYEFLPAVWSQIFRRSMLEDNHIRFYHGILHEDNLFTFQCAVLAQRTAYLNKEYYHRRMRGDSIVTSKKSMRNVDGYLVTYAEIMAFMHNRQVEPEAFEQLSEFLYTSVWGNASRIYRSLDISEEEAVLTHGDFCAAHFLDMIKRSTETEFERSRLKAENKSLRWRVQNIEKRIYSSTTYRVGNFITYIPRKIVGCIRCIRDHGFAYTVRRVISKIGGKLRSVDQKYRDNKLYKLVTWLPRKVRSVSKTIRKYGADYYFRAWNTKLLMKKGADAPFVSVIMPVYNAEDFLEQGLDTLINQTLRNIEIICVDDGSTDSSLEILNRYAAKDSRVRVFTQQNKFAGAARNLGLANARGEYVIFLDSDDFFARSLCEDTYFMGRTHNADVVIFGAKHYNNTTGKYSEAKWRLNNYLAPEKQPFSYLDCPDELYRITTPVPWTKTFRRQFVLDAGLQFQAIHNANDLFFVYSGLAMAKRIVTLDKALVYYRIDLQTNLQTKKKKYPFCFYDAYLAWHDKLAELGILDAVRKGYVHVALSGCLHNLRTNKDLDSKRMVFDKLKNEAFEKLEVCGYDESYYLVNKNYQDMMLVLESSFEDYLEAENTN